LNFACKCWKTSLGEWEFDFAETTMRRQAQKTTDEEEKRKVTWVGGNWQGQSTCYFKKRAGWAWGELAWGQARPTVNDKKGIKAGSVQVE